MIDWLALVIGNTRWHWAWFQDDHLQHVWHHEHLVNSQTPTPDLSSILAAHAPSQIRLLPIESLNIWAVSVVPSQTRGVEHISTIRWLRHFPLEKVYPTMGLDRIVTLWGAGQHYSWPTLVIDGGTALTFTAGDAGTFVGGAILLGVRSHLAALHHYTAALPHLSPPPHLPTRWAQDTPSAIQGGVIHTILASIHEFIHSWISQYPDTSILFTGGDGEYLHRLYLAQYQIQQNQALVNRTWFDPNLMFWGISAYRKEETREL
ncbi:pantothenate kinase [Leptolyngbyaceae cyanobacterium CCMR0082]|uniref:Type III pantothenate kinase n=2 Tax=Adonisia turfae TaxID=2950184 RepID=A0A6M0S087_9CYAN|nr:pantothenate kinase [Adonisia turfae]MDV3350871.1 pantothenate kinase [Leptothoe sp. LEGE 181152]NEZ58894.1 pantothenate kinase [Adonisia turfae CCMR0081]NEZ61888.1 pantothenate kinase [Adonisia turfae CCMR0082]